MEQHLKQRLVGAVVLVSLAVIFIPVILEGPDDELTPRFRDLPEAPQIDFNASVDLPLPSARQPAAASPAPRPEAVPEPKENVEPEVPPNVTETAPAPPPAPPPAAPAPPPAAAVTPAAPAPGWYAQVGSFSQQENAGGLRDRLDQAGYAAHLQSVSTASGSSYRVLIGPSATRAAAEGELAKLTGSQQLNGIVIELPATAR